MIMKSYFPFWLVLALIAACFWSFSDVAFAQS